MQQHDHQYQNEERLSRMTPLSGVTRLDVTMAEYLSLISALPKQTDEPIDPQEAGASPVTLAQWVR